MKSDEISRADIAATVAICIACVLYATATVTAESYGMAFFLIPVVVGAVAGTLDPNRPYRASFIAVGVALLLAIVTLQEGVVCVLFSLPVILPLLLVGAYAGAVVGRYVRTRRGRRLSVVGWLIAGLGGQTADALIDDPTRHPVHAAASEIHIDGSPTAVFRALTGPALEVTGDWPWFLRVGLPIPSRMSIVEPGVGGRARFDFDQGSAFAKITHWEEGVELSYEVRDWEIHDLPFHITRLGRSPDYGFRSERVEDWMTIRKTTYTMRSTPGGGTILARRVVWQRHLFPSLYFGWLQQTVMERGQDRLLELIAERVDSAAPNGESLVYCGRCRQPSHRGDGSSQRPDGLEFSRQKSAPSFVAR